MRAAMTCALWGLALGLLAGPAHAQTPDAADERAVRRVSSTEYPLTPDDPAHRWALLIGVDQYDSEAIRDLSYAGNDVKTIADRLVQSGSWRRDHIVVMTSEPVRQSPRT